MELGGESRSDGFVFVPLGIFADDFEEFAPDSCSVGSHYFQIDWSVSGRGMVGGAMKFHSTLTS